MGPNLFVILHDGQDGIYGAEDAQCHHGLIFALLILLTLQNLTEDLRLHRGKALTGDFILLICPVRVHTQTTLYDVYYAVTKQENVVE